MIIKGKARGRAKQLAQHLLRTDENETVELCEARGMVAQDVGGALAELEYQSKRGRSTQPLYHASISPAPDRPITRGQMRMAVDLLEERLGFTGQPRIIVAHRKQGREHFHAVWLRIDASGRAIPMSWNYAIHEDVSRQLEAAFGHERVEGVHHHPSAGSGKRRGRKAYEDRQRHRSGIDPRDVRDRLTALWRASHGGLEFRSALERAGYRLARGDRRGYVVIDPAGEVHSLSRRLQGITASAMRQMLADVPLSALPSMARIREVKRGVRGRRLPAFREVAAEVTALRPARQIASRQFRKTQVEMRLAVDSHNAMPEFLDGPTMPMRLPARMGWRQEQISLVLERAIILAHYAGKLAAARQFARRDELPGIIEQLLSEREAALSALIRRSARRYRSHRHVAGRPISRKAPSRRRKRYVRRKRARVVKNNWITASRG